MGKRQLSETERRTLRLMREAGVLEDIDGNRIDCERGTVMIVCSDPFRRHDIFTHKEGLIADRCPDKLIFPIMIPGGILRLSDSSPTNARGSSLHNDLVGMVRVGMKVLSTTTIVAYLHFACALAGDDHIDVLRAFDITFQAKEFLKKEIPKAQLSCFAHVDWGTGDAQDMNTYFISGTKYRARRREFSPLFTVS